MLFLLKKKATWRVNLHSNRTFKPKFEPYSVVNFFSLAFSKILTLNTGNLSNLHFLKDVPRLDLPVLNCLLKLSFARIHHRLELLVLKTIEILHNSVESLLERLSFQNPVVYDSRLGTSASCKTNVRHVDTVKESFRHQ
jgi:hypothetical protein